MGGCLGAGIQQPGHDAGNIPRQNHSIEVTDSVGEKITLDSPPQRIVLLNGRGAELVIALGAGDRIVGLPATSLAKKDIAPYVPNAVSVSGEDSWTPNFERLVTLHPDLVILYSQSLYQPKNYDRLKAANLTLMHLDAFFIPELPHEARMMGKVLGKEDRAEQYAEYVEQYLNLINTRLANVSTTNRPRVYMEMYNDYSAQGNNTQGDAILTLLHADNIAHNMDLFPTVSAEWVVAQDPDVIVKWVSSSSTTPLDQVYNDTVNRPGLSNTSAVKNHRVYIISGDVISSPRGIAGLMYMAKALHPEEFADINPDQILTDYASEYHPGADKIATYYPVLKRSSTGNISIGYR
jgi:ABC-type Fe3+-hydroxamate transport system, periplasmic component